MTNDQVRMTNEGANARMAKSGTRLPPGTGSIGGQAELESLTPAAKRAYTTCLDNAAALLQVLGTQEIELISDIEAVGPVLLVILPEEVKLRKKV